MTEKVPEPEVLAFEAACVNASVTPTQVFKKAGLHTSLWWRWRSGDVSPTLKSLRAAREALPQVARADAA